MSSHEGLCPVFAVGTVCTMVNLNESKTKERDKVRHFGPDKVRDFGPELF